MALPVTISSSLFPAQNYFCGPFKSSGGNFYTVLRESSGITPEVYKATDPTTSFSAQDAANNPVNAATTLWAYQVGDVLHIVTYHDSATSDVVYYHTFNMATDAWVTKDEVIESPKDTPGATYMSGSIALRSDGDVIVLYNGDQDTVMGVDYQRVDYARKEVSTWTVGVAVDAAGEVNYSGASVVLGASDRMHFFFTEVLSATDRDVQHRSLSSANALDTVQDVDATASPTTAHLHYYASGVRYVSGANTVVKAVYIDGDGELSSAEIAVSGADPTITTATVVSDLSIRVVNGTPVACLAVDGTTTYLLYADSSTSDLWRDSQTDGGAWGTDAEVLDAVTINRVSCAVYDRSGTKLAYVYDDGGTVKYNEVSLSVFDPVIAVPGFAQLSSCGFVGRRVI